MQIADTAIRVMVNRGRRLWGMAKKKLKELPMNRARVVRPKEKPGACGRCEVITQSVTAVVTLKRTRPRQHRIIWVFAKARRGAESTSEMVAMARAPKRSARKPPASLPTNTDVAGSTKSSVVLRSKSGVYEPTAARTMIESRQSPMTIPGRDILAGGKSKAAW